jgi:triosephosphate isomerase
MNKTPGETRRFISELKTRLSGANAEIVICPPFACLAAAQEALAGSPVALGAQNMHYEDSGAYTGEVSADILKELGVEYVIIGHSERREYFAETDELVNKKVKKALQKGLKPIVCVGERLEQREAGLTEEVVRLQTKAALSGLLGDDMQNIIIAYEPIWAIGTGRTATAQDANITIKAIRNAAREMAGDWADVVRILYGGSMKPENVTELMAMSDIDGGLIGGASLDADSFARIIFY